MFRPIRTVRSLEPLPMPAQAGMLQALGRAGGAGRLSLYGLFFRSRKRLSRSIPVAGLDPNEI